ncbi:hypothetical protein B7R54_16060 [Subtercola boreus]|uniref:Choice-of-anchor G family protein n=1 Tax=Subtercola boreus TaxID=120213 RepID=A0A3E0VLF8_9MICO|nr:choice-of-anchor G family protein [Subtercola boreus]RFA10551.1 hypothetical protein B7R54_16060 [Subtercola boreus]TQL55908.1 hypothetical protein FB464_3482 [Subtercola boreus]
MLAASLAMGTTLALAVPASANAQTIVSQGTGRLVTTSLLTTSILDSLPTLKGADAVNTTAAGDVIVDRPLDAGAISGLTALSAGGTAMLFGDAGVVRLGAVGQYGRANNDGSSMAFSGTVASTVVMLAGPALTRGGPVGTPTTGSAATLLVGNPVTDPVALKADFVELSASADQSAAGAQSGGYRLGALGLTVGGPLVATPVSTIRPALDAVIAALAAAGAPAPSNPFPADFTMKLTTADLQAAGLPSDLNDLPADTDLTQFIPLAVSNQITREANDYLATATAAIPGVPVGMRPALTLAITTARAIVDPIVMNLGSAFQGLLGIALRNLTQFTVNHRDVTAGTFTETALRIGLGPNGTTAQVDLASASVGPNAGPIVQPTTTPTTTATTAAATAASRGDTGTTATLAHTGLPLESQLVPWGTLAFALLGAGFAAFTLTANRRRRAASGS